MTKELGLSQGLPVSPTISQRSPAAPRDRDQDSLAAVLCLLFKLNVSEGRALIALLGHDYRSPSELHTGNYSSAVRVIVHTLRTKLKPHGITITTVPKLGYCLDRTARDRIRKILAQHDAGGFLLATAARTSP